MLRNLLLPLLSAFLLLSCDSPSENASSNTPNGAHQSSMVIQIHRPENSSTVSSNFLANQIAILTTGNVLDLASEKSNIDANTIKDSLVIEALKGTDLVRLTAHNDDAAQAKTTVESLVEAFAELRKQQWKDQAAASLEAMVQELRDQEDLVQDYRKALTVLIQQYGISYSNQSLASQVGQSEEAMYRRAQEKLDQLEKDGAHLGIADRKLTETPKKDRATEALKQELQHQRDLTQGYRKALRELIEKQDISNGDAPSATSIEQAEEAMYRRAQEKLDQLEQDRNHLQIQIRKLLNLPTEELIKAFANTEETALYDKQVTTYYTEYRAAEEQVSAMNASGLGSEHPQVIAMKAKAKKALENAGKEVVSLKEVLETRLNLVDKQVERMKQMIREKNDSAVDANGPQHNYKTARAEYEQARVMLREMRIKQQEQRILLARTHDPITIHERAK